jgi:drug/metabolite transporter (DMT)-like permease
VLLPILAALLYALAAIITRARCRGERALNLAIGLNLGLLMAGALVPSALTALPLSAAQLAAHPFLFGAWAPMDLGGWLLMTTLALLMLGFGTGVAMAYQLAPAAVVGAFDYSYVVFAVLWSALLLGRVAGRRHRARHRAHRERRGSGRRRTFPDAPGSASPARPTLRVRQATRSEAE